MAHWTERSTDAFLYRITADLLDQLEERIQSKSLSKAELAKKLGVSKGRISQILNNPKGNLSLKTIIRYARALGMKVTIVAYDDGDPDNQRGPINSDIFRACWENSGQPADFWSVQELQCAATNVAMLPAISPTQIVKVSVVHVGQEPLLGSTRANRLYEQQFAVSSARRVPEILFSKSAGLETEAVTVVDNSNLTTFH